MVVRIFFLLQFLLLAAGIRLQAQVKTDNNPISSKKMLVEGTVRDKQLIPLTGASVLEKGSNRATKTNDKGEFKLEVNQNSTLVVSFAGFQTMEVNVKNQQQITVQLEEDVNPMDAVVVIGYGSNKKSNLTNSVSTVDFKKLSNTPQSSTLNILSGRVPGLSVVQTSGSPGDDNSELSIRGALNPQLGDASPLVIIDGVPSTLKDLGTITPSQIANISVLKDASSTAIYGARGANGVILVTTTIPKKGKLKLGLNSYYGVQQATYLPKFVESWQWMELHNEAVNSAIYPQYAIENVKNGILNDTFANSKPVPTLYSVAPMSLVDLNLNGGGENIRFQGALSYFNQDGIITNTNSERYNYRSNIGVTISKKLEAGLNISGYFQNNHRGYFTAANVLTQLYRTFPITPDKYSNGDPGVYNLYNGTVLAPANLQANIGTADTKDNKGNYVAFLQLTPIRDLVFKSTGSYTKRQIVTKSFLPTYSYASLDGRPALLNNINTLNNYTQNDEQLQISTTGTYILNLQNSTKISILAGHEFTRFNTSNFSIAGSNLPSNDLLQIDRATTNFIPGGNEAAWRLQSFFGRLGGNISGKYLLEANFRADGSSRFPVNNRYSFFPSVSAGWIVSNEKFLKDNAVINQLKLRASYGKSGNDRIGNYTYQQTLNLNNYYYFGTTLLPGAAQTNYANQGIKWETTTSWNAGIDMSFFKNSLHVTMDLFDRNTDDLLYTLQLAPSFGSITPAVQNIASINNRGYELDIQYRKRIGNLSFDVGGILSYLKNKVVDLKGITAISGSNILQEGQDINAFYGYKTNGIFRTQEEVNAYPHYTTGFQLGSLRYADINNDNKINDLDRTVIGTGSTPYTFGFTAGMSYRNFDMNFLLQGVQGKSVYLQDWGNRPGNAAIIEFWKEWYTNRFEPVKNPGGTWPSFGRNVPVLVSEFYVQDASYLRLKNLEIGYTLPQKILQKGGINSLRIYATGQNLFTFTSLIKQVDPERAARQQGNLNYPQTRVFTFGINVLF